MAVAFPLTPAPAWYATCSFPTRNGIFYADGTGEPPTVTLSKSGATGYTVRDYTGATVSSGAVSGSTVIPAAPAGGWLCGWYRIYFTGASTDALFGPSYGATNFLVVPHDARFPANPAVATSGSPGFGESPDFVTKGVLGIGTSRLPIDNAATPTSSVNGGTIANCLTAAATSNTWWRSVGDGVRTRELWCNLGTQGLQVDGLAPASATSGTYLRIYCKNETIDGSTVFVQTSAGSSSGTKVRVFHPDAVTLVETYDNLATSTAAATAIAASAWIVAFDGASSQQAATTGPTAIGRSMYAGTSQYVGALYPSVKYFEGPSNEPALTAETAHQMRLFAAAVHAGNAGAKAIGPCPVNLNPGGWDLFLAAGGGAWCDGFSFHDYNSMTGGNLPLGRYSISQWVATLTKYGQQNKLRWQTEAGQAFKSAYGVYHPRRAVWKLLHTLLWEQYGVPAERNAPWYDGSHGFWSFPAWLINSDTSLNPEAAMLRTLTAETWGKTFASALSFGAWGDAILLGNVYTGSDGTSTVALCASSHVPGQTVALTVTGVTGSLTTVDAWGNTSTATISGGRVTVPIAAQPSYLRLPAGAAATVYAIGDWPAIGVHGQGANSAPRASTLAGYVNDGQWITSYGGTGVYQAAGSPPDTVVLAWDRPQRFDRVLIWNAMSWQSGASLLDFDVQTSPDGTTWTTRATVTKTATSFMHGTDFHNAGCQYETYWDEQWIFDVRLPAPVTAPYLRLYVRATSYGGEPDANALAAGGQGGNPCIVLQEIAVLCDDNVTPQYVTVAG